MIDGPRIAAASGNANSLVVFLHGYGADGGDLIEIGRMWAGILPNTAFAAPHAPDPMAGSPVGRQWFPLTLTDPGEFWRGVRLAHPALDAFLDAELTRLGLNDSRMALVGFSQGTMMALHAGPRRKRAPAAIIGYSGLLAGAEHLGQTAARPPVLLCHGGADELIPATATEIAARALGAAGFPVEWHVSPGLAHGIDESGLTRGATFLHQVLGQR